jgi:hypothetical protein
MLCRQSQYPADGQTGEYTLRRNDFFPVPKKSMDCAVYQPHRTLLYDSNGYKSVEYLYVIYFNNNKM